MDTNRNKLALRKQSIRVLTADELRVAHGGVGAGETTPTGPGTSITTTHTTVLTTVGRTRVPPPLTKA
jgi:hypothetical protein